MAGGPHNKFGGSVEHQYTRHIFFACESPSCSNFNLQNTASDHQVEYPDASSAVFQKMDMDDYLHSFQSVSLLKTGGFHLKKNFPALCSM